MRRRRGIRVPCAGQMMKKRSRNSRVEGEHVRACARCRPSISFLPNSLHSVHSDVFGHPFTVFGFSLLLLVFHLGSFECIWSHLEYIQVRPNETNGSKRKIKGANRIQIQSKADFRKQARSIISNASGRKCRKSMLATGRKPESHHSSQTHDERHSLRLCAARARSPRRFTASCQHWEDHRVVGEHIQLALYGLLLIFVQRCQFSHVEKASLHRRNTKSRAQQTTKLATLPFCNQS